MAASSTSGEARSLAETRKDLLKQLGIVMGGWSVNGRDVSLTIDFDFGADVGGFLTVTTPEGERLLVQVEQLRLIARDAVQIDVDTSTLDTGSALAPGTRTAHVGLTVRFVEGDARVLGAITATGVATSSGRGFALGEASLATDAEVSMLVQGALGSSAGLDVGRLEHANIVASLKASGFSRHTFLCGQSGSGKTYSMGVLLERLLAETDLRLVVIDPNSDYVSLGKLRSRADINRGRQTPLSTRTYNELKHRYEARAGVKVARATGGDLPLRIHISDLSLDEQALALGLDPIDDSQQYAAYVDATTSIGSDVYSIADVESTLVRRYDEPSRDLAQRITNLGIASWGVWAASGETSLAKLVAAERAVVLDTGSLADGRQRSVIALALLGALRRRPNRSPISIVIDEAHNVCSPDARTPIERAVAFHAVWIAGEGRKFGLYMVLATQRPQKVDRNVISQCDNLLLMRVNSTTDLNELAEIFSFVPASMIAGARSFQQGEVLAAGTIAPTPIRLRVGERWTAEGGADLPTTWAAKA